MVGRPELYVDDFFTGLLAGLVLGNVTVLETEHRFHKALEKLCRDVGPDAIRFRVRTHPIHGESKTVQDALYGAAQRLLVTFDTPARPPLVRIQLSPEGAREILKHLPWPREEFERLAKQFMEYYEKE